MRIGVPVNIVVQLQSVLCGVQRQDDRVGEAQDHEAQVLRYCDLKTPC